MGKKVLALVILSAATILSCAGEKQKTSRQVSQSEASFCRWPLAVQTISFSPLTFYEAMEKTSELGLKYVEALASQPLSKEHLDVPFYTMRPELMAETKQKLARLKVKLINFYYYELPGNEAGCRRVFEFAKDLGVETIISEPPVERLDTIEKLCDEYKINLAIHNHPNYSKANRYSHPDKVLEACKGRSKRIGACADVGHWYRSGFDPVESLRKLQGRIITIHFKDVDDEKHDTIWGTGNCNAKAMLAELCRQEFAGVISIEYGGRGKDIMAQLRQCIDYFNKTTAEPAGGGKPKCCQTK